MSNIRAIRGMNDILPEETPYWQALERTVAGVLAGYGYGEIRLPVVELTEAAANPEIQVSIFQLAAAQDKLAMRLDTAVKQRFDALDIDELRI